MRKKIVIEALNPLHGSVNYLKELRELSRKNRNSSIESEEKIWIEVLMKRKIGYKFLRQKPIDRFILDFYCSELNLAIEIDEGSHNRRRSYDEVRDLFLSQVGIKTIRFTNGEVLNNIDEVRKKIINFIFSFYSLPCQGEI